MEAFQVDMFFLRYILTAASVAAFLGTVQAAETAERQYVAIAKLPADGIKAIVGQVVEVDVDLSATGSLEANERGDRLEVLYRMSFNQLAAGRSRRR